MKSFELQSLQLQAKLKKAVENHKKGGFSSAVAAYQELLIESPERSDILYNLALAFISLDDIQSAQYFLEKTLDKKPNHFDALNNLGALLLKQDNFEQALHCFSAALAGNPEHLEARNNLAAVLLQLGRYGHAREHYRILIQKLPEDLGVQYSYGVSLLESGELESAVLIFQQILEQNPFHLNAQSNLGIAYFKLNQADKAREIFKIVLAQNPDSPEIQYLYAALSNENVPEKAPKEYIQNLFDHYASYYESHMTDKLHYDAPNQLLRLLEKYFYDNGLSLPDKNWEILDLGCGTGLSGEVFKPLAKSLTGIDLSEKMLKIARHKSIYHHLIHRDLLDYLHHNIHHRYHLLLAADAFNYFGSLDDLFKACYKNLRFNHNHNHNHNNFLLFSLESSGDKNHPQTHNAPEFTLNPHGRYLHRQAYIEKAAKKNHFKILLIQSGILRQQNHQPVQGFLCLMCI